MNSTRPSWKTVLTLIAFMGLMRVIPHPWNFAPAYGACLYLGATLKRSQAFAVIVLTMAVCDLVISYLGWHPYEYSFLHMSSVYASYLVIAWGGQFLRKLNVSRVALGGVGAALSFFILTNFGMWLIGSTYPKTMAGLVTCFVAALPFFGNTLVSSVLYAGVFFGAHAWLTAKGKYPLGSLIRCPVRTN